jgi:hypothetical protein
MALPSQPVYHSPFTICMVTEGAIPLLSACKFLFKGQKLLVARSQLRLIIGCLKSLAKAWPRAAKNMQELQIIAREVLGQNSREKDVAPQGNMPQYSGNVEPVRIPDPSRVPDACLLENLGDVSLPPIPLAGLDAFWAADVQIDLPRWFDYS